jgi:hypothetical protein
MMRELYTVPRPSIKARKLHGEWAGNSAEKTLKPFSTLFNKQYKYTHTYTHGESTSGVPSMQGRAN